MTPYSIWKSHVAKSGDRMVDYLKWLGAWWAGYQAQQTEITFVTFLKRNYAT